MRVQLWSYNYDPEPTGIGPMARVWVEGLREHGHHIDVVAAHPHYPAPIWGSRRRPYREVVDGVPVLRLPLWIGHDSARQRVRQEIAHSAWLGAALPALGRPDVIVAVSPSFPALLPTMIDARTKGVPWTLWLQDILPDGAATTGLIRSGPLLTALRGLERIAYRSADRIFVISDAFQRNLVEKGVPGRNADRGRDMNSVVIDLKRLVDRMDDGFSVMLRADHPIQWHQRCEFIAAEARECGRFVEHRAGARVPGGDAGVDGEVAVPAGGADPTD